ncbi:MAG: long-chain-fatty-acid--CoA ligase [Pyrinomonadaceae bacterium]|nr:long-chain-fatty-acid--CoA ligase [Pyrinomonadaceae bacterium]
MSREKNISTEVQTEDPRNLGELLEQRVAAAPDKPFIFSEADGRRYTFAKFEQAVNRAACLLFDHGINRGDVISLLMPNSVEYVIAYFACFKLGALANPINSLLKSREMKYVMSDSEAKVLLVHSEFRPQIESVRDELPNLRTVIEFDDETQATEGVSSAHEGLPVGKINPDDDAILIYTSGTTGRPKGCLLTHRNLIANARQITNWLKFTERDRLLTMMPLFHMNAVSVTTMTPLYAGASTVVSPKFSASKFWQIISDYGITSFGSVATMLSMLLATYPEGVPAGLTTSQLRFAMCGSAPVPAEVLRRFEERFDCLVIEGYGLSESTCRSTFNPPNENRRLGSCGQPIGNEMKIVDEDGNEVPDGTSGEILLRGENILKGYYKNGEANDRAFREGWFHTGDIGYRDMEGFYFIIDRKSDMIIRAGENIYPREIDEVLYTHPAIAAAAVIGVPDDLYGEEVAAFVVLKEGANATQEEILSFCRVHLADYKCPKSVRFVADIPKGPTGKLLKRELARLYC